MIEDSPSGPNNDGVIDWKDAKAWADGDYNGDGVVNGTEGGPQWPLQVPVLADYDDYLWNTYTQECTAGDLFCLLSCKVTPQNQIFDQGGVTVDDTCRKTIGSTCDQCGYNEPYTKGVLEKVLPPQWCGTATP